MENDQSILEKPTPKHVFLHLFVIIMLYASTINFVTLLFQYINYWVKDPLSKIQYYYTPYNNDLIKFGLASIIVIFPVFVFATKFLNKSYLKNPAVREMRIRKWLIYFTLFVAALIIIGDLVSVILTFLNGEATLRFILKALAILVVTGMIFYYYLHDLKGEPPSQKIKIFSWSVALAVVATVVAGFFVVGSPKTSRALRFDAERINNLQIAQSEIINYWQNKNKLPETLDNLRDSISGYKAPQDPETGANYEYIVTGPTSFTLCANFNLSSEDGNNPATTYRYYGGTDNNWTHGKGRACFERTIDPEIYKPFDKIK